MANNFWQDKKGRYEIKPATLETVDGAVLDYFDKKLKITVDTDDKEGERKKVPVVFAIGERWHLVRDRRAIRDQNGTLILPLITIRRLEIDRTPGQWGMAQEVPYIVVSNEIHEKNSNIMNLVQARRNRFFVEPKKPILREYLTIPFPDFATIYYEITIWAQFQTQMNEILEKIFYHYDHLDSFVMPVEYDGDKPKGSGYYFVGFRDGDVTPESNMEEFSDQERVIRYTYTIKSSAYLMPDPKDSPLAYGKDRGESPADTGKFIINKFQSTIDVKLKENVISLEEFKKLFGG